MSSAIGFTLVHERRRSSATARLDCDRVGAGIDIRAIPDRIRDLEMGVAEVRGECRSETSRRRRLGQAHHHLGYGCSGLSRPEPLGDHAKRHEYETHCLNGPQASVDVVVGERARASEWM